MRKRTGMRAKAQETAQVGDGNEPLMTKTERAQAAMLKRSRDQKKDSLGQYYMVIYAFVGICVLAVGLSLFNPKQKFSEIQAIDDSAIMVHNGYQYQFKQGANEFFSGKTLADVKPLFMNGLSDSNQNHLCLTSRGANNDGKDEEIIVPETYDWRTKYPECVQPVLNIGIVANCSASYAYTTLGVAEDRICMKAHEKIRLSTQEILDCDVTSNGCEGGFVNKVLAFGSNKGFLPEECYETAERQNECEEDHFENNQCRMDDYTFKVHDHCISAGEENIKREIIKNGPVIGQMTPFTDFLAYKEGTYHKTPDAFKFNGQHLVKIIGWGKSMDGSTEWIIENHWGSDWGEKGYAKIASGKGDTNIEGHAIGFLINAKTNAEVEADRMKAPEPQSAAADPLGDMFDMSNQKKDDELERMMNSDDEEEIETVEEVEDSS